MPRTGRPAVPAIDRFADKYDVDPLTGCWLWNAGTYHDRGYLAGQFYDGKRTVRAHRFAWEYQYGPIPDGQQLYRTCPTILCVNPAHQELGPVNRLFACATHCPSGHPYEGDNLYTNPNTGARMCRTCSTESSQRNEARPGPYRLRTGGNYRDDVSTGVVVGAYAMGGTLREIGKDMGISKTTVRRRLKAVNAPARVGAVR